MIPFLAVNGCIAMLAMYVSLYLLALSPVLTLACRRLCANDDAYFQLLQLRLVTRFRVRNVRSNRGKWIISPAVTRRVTHGR